jgi:hypothetical protein
MRLTYCAIAFANFTALLLPALAQADQTALYYYRNGVRHELVVDQLRRVDLATGKGAAPKVVSASVSAKALGDTTQLLIDVSSQTEQALPGGVLVTMPLGVNESEALAKLGAQGISNASPVVGVQVWKIPSASGLIALQLANRLHESGQFLAVEPNWWRKRPGK